MSKNKAVEDAAASAMAGIVRKYGPEWRTTLSLRVQEDVMYAHAVLAVYRQDSSEELKHAMAIARAMVAMSHDNPDVEN